MPPSLAIVGWLVRETTEDYRQKGGQDIIWSHTEIAYTCIHRHPKHYKMFSTGYSTA